MLSYAICLLALSAATSFAAEVHPDDFLEKFGYLDPVAKRSGNPLARSFAKTRAIKDFQRFAHLPETGVLDDATKEKMLAPRCGMPDKSNKLTRASFYSKWDKNTITWKYVKPTNQLDSGRVRKAIKEAFAVWATVIPLTFTEVGPNDQSDMQFGFGTKDHADGFSFDGRGSVLAHAFFPKDGRLHFDDDELWTYEDASQIKDGSYTDLLSVTIHEMGHALGLPHLQQEEAIMYPYYRHPELDSNGKIKPFVLNQYDINAIQEAYGPRDGSGTRPTQKPTTPEPTPPGGPSQGAACPRFTAAVTGADGATYFFGGNSGWKKTNAVRDAPNSATRFYLDRRFPNGPQQVTAGVTDKMSSVTYLFQGRRAWAYSWQSSTGQFTLEKDYPKDLQQDVSFTPEGAFQLNGGHLILFAGDRFVIYNGFANTANFENSVSSYFGNFPSKTSFNVEDRVYFLNGNDYTVFDVNGRKAISTAPMNNA
jgi:hypothetical protein